MHLGNFLASGSLLQQLNAKNERGVVLTQKRLQSRFF
jgi:hypothetical protein